MDTTYRVSEVIYFRCLVIILPDILNHSVFAWCQQFKICSFDELQKLNVVDQLAHYKFTQNMHWTSSCYLVHLISLSCHPV